MMHKIIDKMLIILPLLLVSIHTFMLIHFGHIRDAYINISHNLDYLVWIGFFLSIFTMLFVYGFIIVHKENIAKLLLCIFTLVSFGFMAYYYDFSRNYPLNVAEKTDYIDNEWLQGITIDQIFLDSDDTTLIYIGEENTSKAFEQELIKQCELYSYQINTYYINDNDNYSELFNDHDITETPVLIVTKNAQIIDKTSNINELATIMNEYLNNGVTSIMFTIYGCSEKPDEYIIDDNKSIDYIIHKLSTITTSSHYLYDSEEYDPNAGITYQLQLNGPLKQTYKIQDDKLLYNDKVYQIEDDGNFIDELKKFDN